MDGLDILMAWPVVLELVAEGCLRDRERESFRSYSVGTFVCPTLLLSPSISCGTFPPFLVAARRSAVGL